MLLEEGECGSLSFCSSGLRARFGFGFAGRGMNGLSLLSYEGGTNRKMERERVRRWDNR